LQANNVTELRNNGLRQFRNANLFENKAAEAYSSPSPHLTNAGISTVWEDFANSSETKQNNKPTEQLTRRGKQAVASSKQRTVN
jgi:hypothetical protein